MFLTPPSRSTPMNRLRNAASSCGAPSPHLAQVLAEYHIPHPVQPVFYPPVPPPDLQQPGSIRLFRWEAGNGVVSPLHRSPCLCASCCPLVPPGSFHAADPSQPGQPKYPFKATEAHNRRCSHRSPCRPSRHASPKPSPQGGCSNSRLTAFLTPGWLSFTTQK